MGVIRSFLARGGGTRRLLREAGSIASMREIERRTSNRTAVVDSFRQNGDPGQAASPVSTEKADRLRDARQYEWAAEAYRAILERAPLRTDIRVQHGNMLKDSGRLDEAEAAYRAALAQAPDDADIYLQLGHALKLQRRRSVAIEAYRRAAELAPFAPGPMLELIVLGDRPIATVDIGCGSQLNMLSIGDDVVAETYRTSGPRSFEPASLMVWFQLAKQSTYAIDVGAFTGIYALVAADANQLIKVAAVEPTIQIFSRLCLNIQINGLQTQIAPLNFAAGDRPGKGLLNHHGSIYDLDCGSTLLAESGSRPFRYSEEVRMLPLDSLAAIAAGDQRLTAIELPQTGPDIVKIDVEGYELTVLAGMHQSIRSSLPIFIIECLSLDRLRAVHDYLAEFSYSPLLIDDENISLIGNVLEHRWETTRNVMFYPRNKQYIIEQVQNNSGVAIRL
jgi:FkbM family methyltransferase